MAIENLTHSPTTVDLKIISNTALFASPLIASAQTLQRGGGKWSYILNFANKSGDIRADLQGLIAFADGQENRFRVPVHDNPKRGAYGGTPLVDGASQTGNVLAIDGCSNNITNWIRRGDYFSVVVNGEHELKKCTQDNDSNGTGQIATLEFEPELRDSPLNNAVIFVEDGVLSKPEGIFLFQGSVNGWSSRPFQTTSELSQIVIGLVEDVFATQS